MKISDNGKIVLKHFESLSLKAYPDPATGGAPWTNGWGHTGPDVKPGTIWTIEQADSALSVDLATFEELVNRVVTTDINQGQFDALVSFAFNVGPGKKGVKDGLVVLKNGNPSSLLRLTNERQFGAAAAQFRFWNKGAGKVMKGLIRRRAAEAALFTGSPGQQAILIGTAAA